MCFIHGKQHSQHPKNYKNQNLGIKMEGDTKDSSVEGSKDREIELIRRKAWRRIKEEVFKKRNWLFNLKLMLILLLENLSHQKMLKVDS